jgi:predicted nucleic acid-binding protein
MHEKYYLDTSVWMDYYEDRKDPSRDIGEYAFKLLCKLFASKSIIVVSDFLMRELETYYSLDMIRGMSRPFESIFVKVAASEEQKEEAKRIAKEKNVPNGDALHAILSRDNNSILVSRDRHFQLLKDICESVIPEEII